MKLALIYLGLVALLIVGCTSNSSYLPYYKTAQWNSFYTGGDGSTVEKAIIINTSDDEKITLAEKHYLDNTLTKEGDPYVIDNKISYIQSGRVFDKYELTVNGTQAKTYHFDVTMPAGQNPAP